MGSNRKIISGIKLTFPEVILFILIAVTPLVSFPGLLDTKLLPRGLFQGCALLVLLIYCLTLASKNKSGPSLRNSLWLIPFLLIAIMYFISSLNAFNRPEAIHWANKISLTMVASFTVFLLVQDKRANFYVISAAVTTAAAISLVMLTVEIFNFDFQNHSLHELSTPFAHKNLFASYLALSLPFIVHPVFNPGKKIFRIISLIILFAALAAIFYLRSKTALAAVMAAGLISLIPVIVKHRALSKFLLIAGGIILIVIPAIFVIYPDLLTPLFDTGSFKERLIVWNNSLEIIEGNFIPGVGGGNWQIFFPANGLHEFYDLNNQVYLGYETFQRPHNDYLWVFSESGIFGFIAYLGILMIPVIDFIRNRRWVSGFKSIHNLMFSGLVAYFVLALSDFSLERFEHQFMLVLLYVFYIPFDENTTGKRVGNPLIKFILIAFSVLIINIMLNFYFRAKAESNHYKVLSAHSAGDWPVMYSQSDITDRSVFSIDNFSIPVVWYKGIAASSMGNYHEALGLFREAFKVNPYQVHVLNNLAGSYQQTGDSRKALYYYRKALDISPLHYEVLLNKSITEFNTGDTTAAFYTLLDLIYKKEHQQTYHTAMPVIFNAYLQSLRTKNYNIKSIDNLIKSDSLKVVLLYHYQIDKKPLEVLLNEFTMEIKHQ